MLVSTRRSLCSRSPPNWVVSMPEQKAGGAPVSDDRADVGVVAERAEGLGQLHPQVDRESVPLLGALQRDHRDVLSALQ